MNECEYILSLCCLMLDFSVGWMFFVNLKVSFLTHSLGWFPYPPRIISKVMVASKMHSRWYFLFGAWLSLYIPKERRRWKSIGFVILQHLRVCNLHSQELHISFNLISDEFVITFPYPAYGNLCSSSSSFHHIFHKDPIKI